MLQNFSSYNLHIIWVIDARESKTPDAYARIRFDLDRMNVLIGQVIEHFYMSINLAGFCC
jgi:hypothetical protein